MGKNSPKDHSDDLPDYIDVIQDILHHPSAPDDALLVTELDGYLAGILVCNETLMPSEWLPPIWGGDGRGLYKDENEAQEILGAIMEMYNDINNRLLLGSWAPLYDIDTDGETPLWEIWLEGFWRAVMLRQNNWTAILLDESNHDRRIAAFTMTRLHQLAQSFQKKVEPMEGDEEFLKDAANIIPVAVEDLHKYRNAPVAQNAIPKTGRNDPCPCGSGKKFKKCCLQ